MDGSSPDQDCLSGKGDNPCHTEPFSSLIDAQVLPVNSSLSYSLCRFLAPWETKWHYPGRHRVILSAIPRITTWRAVQYWLAGTRPIPADVAREVARLARQKAAEALSLAEALEDHANRLEAARRPSGFCVVGADGNAKRGHWRR